MNDNGPQIIIPDWRKAWWALPPDFRKDGASDPFQFAYWFVYSAETRQDISMAARMHDGGYGPLRLAGSGFEQYGRHAWNVSYRAALLAYGHPRVARLHYWAVEKYGERPWRENWEDMRARGWHSWDDFLADMSPNRVQYQRCAGCIGGRIFAPSVAPTFDHIMSAA